MNRVLAIRLRASAALVLLAVMFVGALAHGWHHFEDHGCESPRPHHSSQDACAVCAALHAAPMPESATSHAAPVELEHRRDATTARAVPTERAHALAPARAPPTA